MASAIVQKTWNFCDTLRDDGVYDGLIDGVSDGLNRFINDAVKKGQIDVVNDAVSGGLIGVVKVINSVESGISINDLVKTIENHIEQYSDTFNYSKQ